MNDTDAEAKYDGSPLFHIKEGCAATARKRESVQGGQSVVSCGKGLETIEQAYTVQREADQTEERSALQGMGKEGDSHD